MTKNLKLVLVAGARPNFMKLAPLVKCIQRHNAGGRVGERTLSDQIPSPHPLSNLMAEGSRSQGEGERERQSDVPRSPEIRFKIVHTGQHYDAQMSQVFFEELGIPTPDFSLDVGSGSHAVQTATVMTRFEPVCEQEKPDWVVVVGDVNSTMACTLVASKMGIRVAHVEAGLRSFDRTMPEEINRLVTDALADLLLTPSEEANENLHREGISDSKVRLVGNVMIDSLIANLDKARQSQIMRLCDVQPGSFLYVTLHRPSNVDNCENLRAIVSKIRRLSYTLPAIFPVHPRTRRMMSEFGIKTEQSNGLRIVEPIGYHDSLCLTENARLVLTDSGGLQEESTFFRTPCLTLRPNTERPVTITLGSNRLTNTERLPSDLEKTLQAADRLGTIPPLWDGKASERILRCLLES